MALPEYRLYIVRNRLCAYECRNWNRFWAIVERGKSECEERIEQHIREGKTKGQRDGWFLPRK